jgi:hypothetical protein
VPAAGTEGANDRPRRSVEHDFGANDSIQEPPADLLALRIGGEAILAEAVAERCPRSTAA